MKFKRFALSALIDIAIKYIGLTPYAILKAMKNPSFFNSVSGDSPIFRGFSPVAD